MHLQWPWTALITSLKGDVRNLLNELCFVELHNVEDMTYIVQCEYTYFSYVRMQL